MTQYLGLMTFTSHHPPVSTLILGSVFRLGSHINGNFGVFLYILLQMLLLAAVEGYMICMMRKMNAPTWLVNGSLLICVFVPYFSAFISVVLKDNFYTYFFLLFIIELTYMICKKELFFTNMHSLLWMIATAGVILLRNNGKYVVYPVTLLLLIVVRDWYQSHSKKLWQRKLIKPTIVLLMPVIAASILSAGIMRHYNIEKGSIREALSLPFQQTARYVLYHENEVAEEEKEDINSILDYSSLAEKYDPRISDPVKATFKKKSTRGDLVQYLKVWGRQFFRHPGTYLEATLNQNYYIVYPFVPNDQIYSGLDMGYERQEELWKLMDIHSVDSLKAAKGRILAYYKLCFRLPVLNLLSHPALYTLLMIWMTVFALMRRKKNFLVVMFPLLLSLLIILLSPVIQGHARYAFPIIYSMPLLIAFYLYDNESDKEGITIVMGTQSNTIRGQEVEET